MDYSHSYLLLLYYYVFEIFDRQYFAFHICSFMSHTQNIFITISNIRLFNIPYGQRATWRPHLIVLKYHAIFHKHKFSWTKHNCVQNYFYITLRTTFILLQIICVLWLLSDKSEISNFEEYPLSKRRNVIYIAQNISFIVIDISKFLTSLDQVMEGSGFPSALHLNSTFRPFFTT